MKMVTKDSFRNVFRHGFCAPGNPPHNGSKIPAATLPPVEWPAISRTRPTQSTRCGQARGHCESSPMHPKIEKVEKMPPQFSWKMQNESIFFAQEKTL